MRMKPTLALATLLLAGCSASAPVDKAAADKAPAPEQTASSTPQPLPAPPPPPAPAPAAAKPAVDAIEDALKEPTAGGAPEPQKAVRHHATAHAPAPPAVEQAAAGAEQPTTSAPPAPEPTPVSPPAPCRVADKPYWNLVTPEQCQALNAQILGKGAFAFVPDTKTYARDFTVSVALNTDGTSAANQKKAKDAIAHAERLKTTSGVEVSDFAFASSVYAHLTPANPEELSVTIAKGTSEVRKLSEDGHPVWTWNVKVLKAICGKTSYTLHLRAGNLLKQGDKSAEVEVQAEDRVVTVGVGLTDCTKAATTGGQGLLDSLTGLNKVVAGFGALLLSALAGIALFRKKLMAALGGLTGKGGEKP